MTTAPVEKGKGKCKGKVHAIEDSPEQQPSQQQSMQVGVVNASANKQQHACLMHVMQHVGSGKQCTVQSCDSEMIVDSGSGGFMIAPWAMRESWVTALRMAR